MGDATADRWLSVDEIAAYLGVERAKIYNWIDRRTMLALRLGICWELNRDKIDDWVRLGAAAARENARKPR